MATQEQIDKTATVKSVTVNGESTSMRSAEEIALLDQMSQQKGMTRKQRRNTLANLFVTVQSPPTE